MKTTSIKRNMKFPRFIREHNIFKSSSDIKKIFPLIGLPNCSNYLNDVNYLPALGINFKKYLLDKFKNLPGQSVQNLINDIDECDPNEFVKNKTICPIPKSLSEHITSNLNKTYTNYRYPYYNHYNTSTFYHNTSTFYGIYYPNKRLTNKTKIVFSSNNGRGVWDIATMSMRGLSSCQSWRGSYADNLIGSIVDPFVGIIYLTDGEELPKGSRMLYRALVRYVVSPRAAPALLLERIYPNNRNKCNYTNIEIQTIFSYFLQKKTKNQFSIITHPASYSIPSSKFVNRLRDLNLSYRDSNIPYSNSSETYLKNIKSF